MSNQIKETFGENPFTSKGFDDEHDDAELGIERSNHLIKIVTVTIAIRLIKDYGINKRKPPFNESTLC